eukprot:COSAG02_NODE_8584_length_2514_cov_1.015735_3_plen_162_part_01
MVNGRQQFFLQVDALTKVISKTTALQVIMRKVPDLRQLRWRTAGGQLAKPRAEVTCTREKRCDECQQCLQWLSTKREQDGRNPLKQENNSALQSIVFEFIGRTVYTAYNDMSYRIEAVRFDMSPADTFKVRTPQSNGERVPTSFADYLQKYQVQVNNFDQPM